MPQRVEESWQHDQVQTSPDVWHKIHDAVVKDKHTSQLTGIPLDLHHQLVRSQQAWQGDNGRMLKRPHPKM